MCSGGVGGDGNRTGEDRGAGAEAAGRLVHEASQQGVAAHVRGVQRR